MGSRSVLSLLSWLVVLVLAASGAATADDGPARQVVESPRKVWRMRIPAGWTSEPMQDDGAHVEGARMSPPDGGRIVLQVQVLRQNPTMQVFVLSAKTAFEERGQLLLKEGRELLNGRQAWRIEYVHEQPTGRGHVYQWVVDGGSRKIIATGVVEEPVSPDAARVVVESLASLELPEEAAPPAPVPYAPRDFPEDGLKLELPEGGALTQEGPGFRIVWKEHGLIFNAAWERGAPPTAERLKTQFAAAAGEGAEGLAPELVETQEVKVGEASCLLLHVYYAAKGRRLLTLSALARPSGDGESVLYGLALIGEAPFETMAPLEKRLLAAELRPHFAPPLAELPPLTQDAEAWEGRATLRVPAGWSASPHRLEERGAAAPKAVDTRLWSEKRATDLGLAADATTIAGGVDAYEHWLRERRFPKFQEAAVSERRPLDVGGRAGFAWEMEYGPKEERWHRVVVGVFDGDRADVLTAAHPVRVAAAYASLAERVAATVRWKK
ncbi:MAG: hypothetical protein HYZ53_27485 [Planctomycetes bacterium]|nr:hypothetical protein [Planctomycetota bacterium]